MSDEQETNALRIAGELNGLLAQVGQSELEEPTAARFASYLSLLMRWNLRVNLTAIRDEAGILSRHFVESIVCARALPPGIETLLDLGSGAGFPGIPIALCRPEIRVTLAESQGKKAAFLREAGRSIPVSVEVHGGRAEELREGFDCVTLRAVDRMPEAVDVATHLISPRRWIALLTTRESLPELILGRVEFEWADAIRLPGGSRVLAFGQKRD